MSEYVLTIDRWHPARLNQWDGRHWAVRARLKRGDREIIAVYARIAGIPLATGKRRVSLTLTRNVNLDNRYFLPAVPLHGVQHGPSGAACRVQPHNRQTALALRRQQTAFADRCEVARWCCVA